MRGKRSKAYRKLMNQYALTFGFREPYQVLVDAEMIEDCLRFKMDLSPALERTLHGKVKPMITQCSIRHLYETKNQDAIAIAKTCERRRCGHHELENPLTTLECFKESVDPKDSKTNKHRYVLATQDQEVRSYMRQIPGVPLIYVARSVMILEPITSATEKVRLQEERGKFKQGLLDIKGGNKRKREDDDHQHHPESTMTQATSGIKKKRGPKGPKGPNPLSMKKPKRRELLVTPG